jgi:hypothetical protein
MAKKPLPPMNPANAGKNPPFVPITFPTSPGPQKPQGTNYESTVGLYAKLYDYIYAGQNQTAVINFKWPKPV